MASLDVSSGSVRKANREDRAGTRASTAIVEHIVALYPGESRKLVLRVYGPRSHIVAIEERGFPHSVAGLEIALRRARAPFNVDIVVSAKHDATPGVYRWSLRIVDATENRVLGEEPIALVILPKMLPKKVASRATKLKRIYEKYGVQVALWAALRTLYPKGATFTAVNALYELLTGRKVSKGTVGNTLKTMVTKGLLERRNGLYRALDLDPKVAVSRVDLKRVRYSWQVLKPRPAREREKGYNTLERYWFSLGELPQPIRKAYIRAREIAEKHGPLTGLYFLLYSLFGVRQTGYLLLWISGWFIVLEPKTGFAHHFYSWLLHWMLQQLGLREGVYYKPNSREHLEAQKVAQRYIRRFYISHQNARRLHYMLWEKSYVWGDNEVHTVRVYYYPVDNRVGIQVLDKEAREELYSEGLLDRPARVEVYTALPTRHVYERNEETYFYRPAGLF